MRTERDLTLKKIVRKSDELADNKAKDIGDWEDMGRDLGGNKARDIGDWEDMGKSFEYQRFQMGSNKARDIGDWEDMGILGLIFWIIRPGILGTGRIWVKVFP